MRYDSIIIINNLNTTRKCIRKPKIITTTPVTGKVVVNIAVDSNGNVIEAKCDKDQSTITNEFINTICMKNAFQLKYEKSDKPLEKSTIIIMFYLPRRPLNLDEPIPKNNIVQG